MSDKPEFNKYKGQAPKEGQFDDDETYYEEFSKAEKKGRAFFNISLVLDTRYKFWFNHVKDVLVVPCESGNTIRLLRERNRNGWGCDLNKVALDNAPSVARPYLKRGDIRSLPFDDKSFDAVMDVYLLEHLTDDDVAMAITDMLRVLRAGGLLFMRISTPGRCHWGFYSDPTHINPKECEEWEAWLVSKFKDQMSLVATRFQTEEFVFMKKPTKYDLDDTIELIEETCEAILDASSLDEERRYMEKIHRLSQWKVTNKENEYKTPESKQRPNAFSDIEDEVF